MKKSFLILLSIVFTTSIFSQDILFKAYNQKIRGEDLKYHSPHDNVNESLLVRSENENNYIEWESEAVPEDFTGTSGQFIFMAGIDVNPDDKHIFKVFIDGNHLFTMANPDDTIQDPVIWKSEADISLEFDKLLVDKYGDLMGYFYLTLSHKYLTPGKPLIMKVSGETSGSRSWFMVFKKGVQQEFFIVEEQALVRGPDGHAYQQLRLDIVHLGDPAPVEIKAEGITNMITLQKGYNVTRFRLPEVEREMMIGVFITYLNSGKAEARNVWVKPVKPVEVHLIHHSHVDIGYTDIQEEVLEKQWSNLETAISLSEATQQYPEEARFKWNIEVMWALYEYMNKANEQEKERVLNAIRNGWLELDAFFGNELLGLCNEEELIRLTESARKISTEAGVPLKSAMISDIPGWSWGVVPVLAKSGVRYLSFGTNESHRIGYTKEFNSDKPFYWISPSGRDSILTWIHGAGYSLFHTGLGYENINRQQSESKIQGYIQQLHKQKYPYNIVPLRYNIGSDNGPPDQYLSDFVKDWNERYITPKLIISTVTTAFSQFEKKYGKTIPAKAGDFTCYWEDGAISSAHETKMNQASAERLGQAERLWAMLNPTGYPVDEFTEAWEMVMLYDEHTWGSWNSISEPLSDFTLQQWNVKRSFAESGDKLSKELIDKAIQSSIVEDDEIITIFNTNAFPVTGPVKIKPHGKLYDTYITTAKDAFVPSQVDKDENIIFIAKDIPALGWKKYKIKPGNMEGLPMRALNKQGRLVTDLFEMWWDTEKGQLKGFVDKKRQEHNWIAREDQGEFNSYYYVKGRDPELAVTESFISFEEFERGPVYSTYLVKSSGPGCSSIEKEVTIYPDLDYIQIVNRINKELIYTPEGVHFSLPINLKNSDLFVSLPFAPYMVENEQINGSNKNFVTSNRYVDLSNSDWGIAIISPDAPIFEVGEITTDPIIYGWKTVAGNRNKLYSYVMNNYWETNYLAAQKGETEFTYYLYPHDAYEYAGVEKKSRELTRPLIPVIGNIEKESRQLLAINDDELIITGVKPSEDGKALMVTVWNTAINNREVNLFWSDIKPYNIYLSNFDEEPLELIKEKVLIAPEDFVVIRAEF